MLTFDDWLDATRRLGGEALRASHEGRWDAELLDRRFRRYRQAMNETYGTTFGTPVGGRGVQ
jgi:hypothetical protein